MLFVSRTMSYTYSIYDIITFMFHASFFFSFFFYFSSLVATYCHFCCPSCCETLFILFQHLSFHMFPFWSLFHECLCHTSLVALRSRVSIQAMAQSFFVGDAKTACLQYSALQLKALLPDQDHHAAFPEP